MPRTRTTVALALCAVLCGCSTVLEVPADTMWHYTPARPVATLPATDLIVTVVEGPTEPLGKRRSDEITAAILDEIEGSRLFAAVRTKLPPGDDVDFLVRVDGLAQRAISNTGVFYWETVSCLTFRVSVVERVQKSAIWSHTYDACHVGEHTSALRFDKALESGAGELIRDLREFLAGDGREVVAAKKRRPTTPSSS